MCIMPVGEGAIRVTTGPLGEDMASVGEAEGSGKAAPGAWAGPLSTRLRRLPSAAAAGDWLARQAARQGERWTLWTPVALGGGSAIYFALLREPQAWVAWLAAAMVGALLIAGSRWRNGRALTAALVLLACGIGGFGAA